MSLKRASLPFTRRSALKVLGAAGLATGTAILGLAPETGLGQSATPMLGAQLPEEKVAQTLERLFGRRPLQPAGDKVKLDAPQIAENGSVVPVSVEASLPMTTDNYVKHVYIIADKNRRPLNAKLTLTPESGKPAVATRIRLASTSDVRAIVEMSNGALYEAKSEVKVTVGGCGG